MALHVTNVLKAYFLFEDIVGKLKSKIVEPKDEDNQYDEGKILGIGPKEDEGWENVFINVKNISPSQKSIWEAGKGNIPNSSFWHEVQPGITRLGFY